MKAPIYLISLFFFTSVLVNAQNATPDQIPKLKAQLETCGLSEKAALYSELSFAWGRKNVDSSLHYATLALDFAKQSDNVHEAIRALNLQGDAMLKKSDCDQARSFYQTALKEAQATNDLEMQGRSLHNLGKQAQACPNNGDPLPYYEEAYNIREKIGDKSGLSSTTQNLGALYAQTNLNKSDFYYSRAMELKEELGDRLGIATVLSNLAGNKMRLSQWEEARQLLERAVSINQELGNDRGLAINYGKLAQVWHQLNDIPQAIVYHKKGLSLLEKFGSPSDLAIALSNLSESYSSISDYPQALDALLRAETIARTLDLSGLTSIIWAGLGNIKGFMQEEKEAIIWYEKALAGNLQVTQQIAVLISVCTSLEHLKNYPKALSRAEEALKLARKHNYPGQAGNALFCKASALFRLKRTPEALGFVRESIEIAERLKQKAYLSEAYKLRSAIYAEMGGEKNVLALEDAQKALVLAQEGGSLLTQVGALDRLSQAYQAIGQTDAAVVHLRKAEQLKDSIYSLSKVRDMTKKELNHEFDKERAIQELQKEKTAALAALELNRQRGLKWALTAGLLLLILLGAFVFMSLKEQQRRRSESLRQKIASDLHDDVGSTLSSISILSESFVRNVEADLDKTRFGNIGEKARTALESISDIVWSVNPENDSMEKLLARMSSYAAEMLENVGTELLFQVGENVESISLPIEKRKDFHLIFKEAINNTAKYSGAPQVWVKLSKLAQEITLEIKDNGKGFDYATIKNGNGLKNMVSRAERMNGKLHIDSAVGKGTVIRLRFIVP